MMLIVSNVSASSVKMDKALYILYDFYCRGIVFTRGVRMGGRKKFVQMYLRNYKV